MLRRLLVFFIFMLAFQTYAQSLKPADFDSDSWKHHPDFSPQATQADRQFGIYLATNLRYHTLPLLMPMQFRLLSSRQDAKAQAFVDEALTRILKTATGKKICQQATNGRADLIVSVFGLTEAVARHLQPHCTPKVVASLPMVSNRPREYVFIHTTDSNAPVEGWTTPHNVSYIFLTNADFNEEFLLRVLAHETAIKLDLKEQWGTFGDLQMFSDILGVRYVGTNSCEVQYAIRHPLIKYSLSALRAQTIESQILFELGLQSSLASDPQKCVDQVTSLLPSMARMGALLKYEKLHNSLQTKTCSDSRELNLNRALQVLQEESVQDLATQRQVSLCDFLKKPFLSSMAFGPFSGGPRPRIGPWAQKALILKKAPSNRSSDTIKKLESLIDEEPRSQAQTDRKLETLLIKESEENPKDLRLKKDADDETEKN